jgi:hypothetical protein
MAAYIFNQANGTLLNAISPLLWAGADITNLEVQSSKLQAVGANVFAVRTAYLNQAGSSYAVAKYSIGQTNQFYTFIRSATGLYTSGYTFVTQLGNGNLLRNNANVGTYAFSGGHNASTTATEIRIEQVGAVVNVYGGPIGSAVLIGTYTDGTPLSGGFSGFQMAGNGTVTPSITAFDNGVAAYEARITWAEAQYQVPTTPTDYSEPLSRGIFRGIERGVA